MLADSLERKCLEHSTSVFFTTRLLSPTTTRPSLAACLFSSLLLSSLMEIVEVLVHPRVRQTSIETSSLYYRAQYKISFEIMIYASLSPRFFPVVWGF